jgi:phosphoribosylanthranilate isomerase
MHLKICGITQPDQGLAIAELGVSALGFMCVRQSPRYITPAQIRAIVDRVCAVDQSIDRVGVFVDEPLEQIQQVVTQANLNGVQLHGSESVQFCQQVQAAMPEVTVIKAFRVRDEATLTETLLYESVVDALLLDAYRPGALHPGQYGGTGHTIAWEMLQQFRPRCAWFLAGGITPANLSQALSWVQPDGIDVSSGVEVAPGNKDVQKVAELLAQLQRFSASAGLAHVVTEA